MVTVRNTPIAAALPLWLAGFAAAQEVTSALQLVPKDVVLLVQADAPGKWIEDYADTRVGRLIAGPTVQGLIEPLREGWEAGANEPGMTVVQRELVDLLAGSHARLTLAMDVELGGPQPEGWMMFAMHATRECERERFEALQIGAAELVAKRQGGVIADRPFGAFDLRVVDAGETANPRFTSMPFRVGNDVVVLMWSGAIDHIERLAHLAPSERLDLGTPLEGSLSARIAANDLLRPFWQETADELDVPFDPMSVLEQFGLLSLERIELRLGPAGEFVTLDIEVTWRGDGGVLRTLVPEPRAALQLVDLVPRHLPDWRVMTLRLPVLYDLITDVRADVRRVPVPGDDGEAAFAEQFGVRPREDLLEHLGDELLQVTELGDFGETELGRTLPASPGLCFAIELTDRDAFAESLETIIRSRGLHAARKTTDYRGFELHRMRLAGIAFIDYAITDSVFAFSINAPDATALRAVLDEAAARRAGEPTPGFPPAIASRLEECEGGWSGISATDLTMLFDFLRAHVDSTAADESATSRRFIDVAGRLEVALREARLLRPVATTRAEPGRIRYRVVW